MKSCVAGIYGGEISWCIECGHLFKEGDMISVSSEGLTFCEMNHVGCTDEYVIRTGRPIRAVARYYIRKPT